MKVFIDTNILLDVLQQRHPHFAAASRIWHLSETKALDGFVSAISFNNIFYIARKQIGRDGAVNAMSRIRAVFGLAPLDAAIIDFAISSKAADFEDAIQAASAKAADCEWIITRNPNDFRAFGILTVTAEEAIAVLNPI
jgi:predicted nucleic acid-binding protein